MVILLKCQPQVDNWKSFDRDFLKCQLQADNWVCSLGVNKLLGHYLKNYNAFSEAVISCLWLIPKYILIDLELYNDQFFKDYLFCTFNFIILGLRLVWGLSAQSEVVVEQGDQGPIQWGFHKRGFTLSFAVDHQVVEGKIQGLNITLARTSLYTFILIHNCNSITIQTASWCHLK